MTFLTLVCAIVVAGVILFALYAWFQPEPVQLLYYPNPVPNLTHKPQPHDAWLAEIEAKMKLDPKWNFDSRG